ncbi:MAG: hypothetical protein IKH71_14745, partial [Oscillospiraceae bacterium]|nr:hypothetical protein [Oscillospiraceae bacterium]
SAIAETDKKYRSRCMYVANQILNDVSDSEECLNDTYLTAWNLMPPERPKYLLYFLLKIIRNHSLNRFHFLNNSIRRKDLSISTEELEKCVAAVSVPAYIKVALDNIQCRSGQDTFTFG